MKHHKISKLLNDSTQSKFVTRKQTELNDLSGSQYSVNKNIRFKIAMLRSDLCSYSDVNIVVKGTIDLLFAIANDAVFKNKAPFRSCVLKINTM